MVNKVMAKHRKRIFKRSEVKLYLYITVFCFLLAIGINFFVKCGTEVSNDIQLIMDAGPEVETIIKLKNEYEEKTGARVKRVNDTDASGLDKKALEELKNEWKDELDPSQIEKYKDTLKKYQEDNDQ